MRLVEDERLLERLLERDLCFVFLLPDERPLLFFFLAWTEDFKDSIASCRATSESDSPKSAVPAPAGGGDSIFDSSSRTSHRKGGQSRASASSSEHVVACWQPLDIHDIQDLTSLHAQRVDGS